jgi:hypothetical protein
MAVLAVRVDLGLSRLSLISLSLYVTQACRALAHHATASKSPPQHCSTQATRYRAQAYQCRYIDRHVALLGAMYAEVAS